MEKHTEGSVSGAGDTMDQLVQKEQNLDLAEPDRRTMLINKCVQILKDLMHAVQFIKDLKQLRRIHKKIKNMAKSVQRQIAKQQGITLPEAPKKGKKIPEIQSRKLKYPASRGCTAKSRCLSSNRSRTRNSCWW